MANFFRQLGDSDLMVSSVALGCWPIAGMTSLNVNRRDSLATIAAALDHGINFLDTAHCYGTDGESEKMIGQAIKGRRQQCVIATKCGIHWDTDGGKVIDGSPANLQRHCDLSLQRLQIDCIDLMYLHRPDLKTPIEDSADAIRAMVNSGKVRYVALSNVDADQARKFNEICKIIAVQPPFNLFQQEIANQLRPWCQQHQISLVTYWPLMKGLLAGKIRRDYKFDPQDKRLSYPIFQGEYFERAQTAIDQIERLARGLELTIAQLVIAWTIAQPSVTSALCGAKRDWQISETAQAMNVELDELTLNSMQQIAASFVEP